MHPPLADRHDAPARALGPGAAGWVAITALLAAASYLAARYVGLGPRPGPWAFWPVNGLLLGIFFRRPYREWGWIGLAAVVSQTLTVQVLRGDIAGGATPLGAVGGVAQAVAGAWVLRRFCAEGGPLGSPRGLAWFVVADVVLLPLLVTPASATAFSAAWAMPLAQVWRPLFVGNSLSILVFAPLLIPHGGPDEEAVPPAAHPAEIAACQAAVAMLAVLTFRGAESWLQYVAFPYAMFPLLAWAALRSGPRWTALAAVTLSAVASWCTARGEGPFAHAPGTAVDNVLQLQTYLAFAAFTSLVLSALTEQRRCAFEKLSLQAAIQEAFFESSAALIVLRDLEGRHVLVNRATEAAYGVPRERLVGRGADALPAPAAALADAHDRRVLERGAPLVFEETLPLPEGERFLVVTRFPVRDHGGAVRYLGMVGREVTVERELASRLQRAQRVEILGQLAAGLAHDLNNLLTVMMGNAALLRAAPATTPEDAEALDELAEAGTRAARLTGRLLSLGRARAAPRAPVALDAALGELAPLLHALARGSVDLVLRPGAPDARVLADVVEIEQVVLNLVSNARDAIVEEGRIELETEGVDRAALGADAPPDEPAARWVRLRVRDTGTGMDAATLARLFEPFFTTKPDAQGTGIGLYTTSVLVRQMGGVIRADSTPGQGTTFEVLLPRADAAPDAA